MSEYELFIKYKNDSILTVIVNEQTTDTVKQKILNSNEMILLKDLSGSVFAINLKNINYLQITAIDESRPITDYLGLLNE